LPGLILELQDRETTFLATKINFTDHKKIIDFPKKKSITEDEFRKKMLKK
jgi:GLPGLI family protein